MIVPSDSFRPKWINRSSLFESGTDSSSSLTRHHLTLRIGKNVTTTPVPPQRSTQRVSVSFLIS